ncbi:MAG: Eco57I restriction-modification methylase [Chlorobi bacterium OLB7]|nr:MAG: Eco57I restriction-modification methylase [Chlorobi bacterium OLB7]
MTHQAHFALRQRNPDVLSCIANLSNDEVFTPPELANRMLDTLTDAWAASNNGQNLWANPTVRFLDPCTKSGIFLREITSRLVRGLAPAIPDLQQRVDHILTRQVFGIGITQLTALLARRSLYCSKHANGHHSIANGFANPDGNVWFQRMEHTWEGTKCTFCGAPQTTLDRGPERENYAYAFIHTNTIHARIAELFGDDMHFDVIIGNPPYQMKGRAGGTRDIPIYHHFVEQAKKLSPRFLAMVIPSRWMATGLGLSEFRQTMLADRCLRTLVDYPIAREVFSGVEVKGGVCYFLRDTAHNGPCDVTMIRDGVAIGPIARDLGEYDVFVRDARAVSILHKVLAKGEPSVNTILSADKEFGWTSNFEDFHDEKNTPDDVPLHYVRKGKRAVGYIARSEITKSTNLIDTWKVMVPSAGSDGATVPNYVLSTPVITPSPSVCTQTFLFFYVGSETAAASVQSYLSTRFLRFLVSLRKITQHATRATYFWVPIQEWDRKWTDAELYKKYKITAEEQAYIESQIRPVAWGTEGLHQS